MHEPQSSAFTAGFLTNPAAQLGAVEHLASLRRSLVSLRTQALERAQQRRHLMDRLVDEEYSRQQRKKQNTSWIAARNRANARPRVSKFDQETRKLEEEVEQLEAEVERFQLVMQVAARSSFSTSPTPL
jgi:hypothetical protein